ncbi:MAG: zinc ribbon domain-containing protein [Dehalococcoidia bacterium]
MSKAGDLYQLQELDLAIDAGRASLVAVEERLGRDEEVIEVREEAARWEATLAEVRGRQRDLELGAEELRSRSAAVERKLYDGSVQNPRELADMQQDLDVLRRQLRGREDEVLNLMLQAEEAESRLGTGRAILTDVEGRWRREQEELRSQQGALEAELESLGARRGQQAQGVDAVGMFLYVALRDRRQGQAVAKVEQGMCQGCRITLPMTVLQRARQGAELVQCTSCERILYVS